ncbi:hypothetical protein JNJ66_03835 [Candidatus Saccharibacteria bacterium]|nr:hypothetical protein [Candidatus Saccharibacteria bacterium]
MSKRKIVITAIIPGILIGLAYGALFFISTSGGYPVVKWPGKDGRTVDSGQSSPSVIEARDRLKNITTS